MRRAFLFLIFIVSFNSASIGQNEEVIGNYSASLFNGKVLLSWTIAKGYTCSGIKIERSLDTSNFIEIGSLEGVCGSTAHATNYSFTDTAPIIGQTNYYRLYLVGVGYSKTLAMNVYDLSNDNYLLYPNPVTDMAILRFDNPQSLKFDLKVLNSMGKEMYETSTNLDYILMDVTDLVSGTYFFFLVSENSLTTIRGKFVVP